MCFGAVFMIHLKFSCSSVIYLQCEGNIPLVAELRCNKMLVTCRAHVEKCTRRTVGKRVPFGTGDCGCSHGSNDESSDFL